MSVTYPPQHHFFRDLQYTLRCVEGREVGGFPAQPHLVAAEGALPVGALVTLVDMVSGRTGLRAASPMYPVTSDIDLRILDTGRFEAFSVTADTLRCGKRNIVLSADIFGEIGEVRTSIGYAHVNFALLPPVEELPLGVLPGAREPLAYSLAGSGLVAPLREQIGIREVEVARGIVEIDVAPYVMNPLGVLQGGVFAILAEAAAEGMARSAMGEDQAVRDLSIRYLAAGRTGPIRTAGRFLRSAPDALLIGIDLRDVGNEDLLVGTALLELGNPTTR